MSHNLREDFAQAAKQSSRAMSSLNMVVADRLNADDQVLVALAKLAPKIVPEHESVVDAFAVDRWSRTLIMLREREASARLDATINEGLCKYHDLEESSLPQGTSRDHLEHEIKTLKEEIGSVAELVVSSHFRRSLTGLLKKSHVHSSISQHEWLEYSLATMEQMINQLEAMSSCATDLRGYNQALQDAKQVFASTLSTEPCSTTAPPLKPNPLVTPPRPAATRMTTRPMSTHMNLAEQVFRRFALTGRPAASKIHEASESNVAKLHEQHASSASSTVQVVAKTIEDQIRGRQGLVHQLYSLSPYATVHLSPGQVQDEARGLDLTVGELIAALSMAESGNSDMTRRGISRLKERSSTPNYAALGV